jgi:uncharacterized protein (TIGR02145 family)
MSENLNVDKFRNGDPIPHAKTDEEWEKAGENGEPAWCYYNNNPDNGDRYGKLYNWYAVNDPRGLAPEGWKIPLNEDWTTLAVAVYLGGDRNKNMDLKQRIKTRFEVYLRGDAGRKMKSTSGWKDDGNGTNSSGFLGLPGGIRLYNGRFYSIGEYGIWWSSSEIYTDHVWGHFLYFDDDNVGISVFSKGLGLSVRCLRD